MGSFVTSHNKFQRFTFGEQHNFGELLKNGPVIQKNRMGACVSLKSAVSCNCCGFMLIVLSLSLLPDYVLVFSLRIQLYYIYLAHHFLVISDFVVSKKHKTYVENYFFPASNTVFRALKFY